MVLLDIQEALEDPVTSGEDSVTKCVEALGLAAPLLVLQQHCDYGSAEPSKHDCDVCIVFPGGIEDRPGS